MKNKIFEKINRVSVLANEIRFKILIALFNSDLKIHGKTLGAHSHSFDELRGIIDVEKNDLSYHLDIMKKSGLIENRANKRGYYGITGDGKDTLRLFGVDSKIVKTMGKDIIPS